MPSISNAFSYSPKLCIDILTPPHSTVLASDLYLTFSYALDIVRISCVVYASYSVSGKSTSCCCTRIGARPTFSIMFERQNEKSYTNWSDIRLNMTGRGDRNGEKRSREPMVWLLIAWRCGLLAPHRSGSRSGSESFRRRS